MFSKALKKRQKLALLLRQTGTTQGRDCLLVTCGDNTGALNYHFRAHGGRWTWVELEERNRHEMEQLLGERVLRGDPDRLPVASAAFDVVVSIDVHEHLDDRRPFDRELSRVVRPGGIVVVTTPNGDPTKLVTRIKQCAGMTKEQYGHVMIGFDVAQHEAMMREVGLVPEAHGSYSRFFTELVELGINLVYRAVQARQHVDAREVEGIAPVTDAQFRSVAKQYRMYALTYPLFWLFSKLDALLFFETGYAVSVVGRRPPAAHG